MNNNITHTLRTGVIAAFSLAIVTACSDNWDGHYDSASYTPNAFDGTTMQALEQQASDFAEIVRATGFDVELNSANTYTVWAPANGTFDKEALLAQLATDTAGIVVKQFVKNHIARYSVPLSLESRQILLLNSKKFTMGTLDEPVIGDINISEENNIKCNNGILHVIDGELPFQYNIFEYIENEYNKSANTSKADSSLYAYLMTANEDSLIENMSVFNGYDENGNKQWVYKYTRRNNTILRDMKALIYEEDSDYIAFIPTVDAYQKRYSLAKSLLNFNPSMDNGLEYSRVDSLREAYGNRFAMTDLFYARSQNESWTDSLKSTQYTAYSWPEHLYYRNKPVSHDMPLDKEVNDILAKVGFADSIICSNGIAYIFDEYPISIYEQFFNKIDYNALSLRANYIDKDTKIVGSGQNVTRNVSSTETMSGDYTVTSMPPLFDEDGNIVFDEETGEIVYDKSKAESVTQSYSYFYVQNVGIQSPKVGFEINNNFSGKYDIYVVTMPIWFRDALSTTITKDDIAGSKAYNFYIDIWEKNKEGKYPSQGTRIYKEDGDFNFSTSVVDDVYHITDTTYIGTYDFEYAYYGEDEPGVIIQVSSNVLAANSDQYSYSILFSGIVLKPHDDDSAPDTEIKASQLNVLSADALKARSQNKTLIKTTKK